jgi:predicted ATPase
LTVGSSTPAYQYENLRIGNTDVIDVTRGKGQVCNEDGKEPVVYTGTQLALKSAGSYGEKPITNAIANFIRSWEFYDIDPDYIRQERLPMLFSPGQGLDSKGGALYSRLSKWTSNNPTILSAINNGMKACGNTMLEFSKSGKELKINEGLSKPLSLDVASDGTLRLLFYYTLPHQPDLPALVGIEEPERNLHPAVLTRVSHLLEQLAQKSQVIITTHSSQLLDCFTPASLQKDLAVVLLHRKGNQGTQAVSLETIQNDRKSVRDWMNDFGIGNAVFQSQLLQDIIGH